MKQFAIIFLCLTLLGCASPPDVVGGVVSDKWETLGVFGSRYVVVIDEREWSVTHRIYRKIEVGEYVELSRK